MAWLDLREALAAWKSILRRRGLDAFEGMQSQASLKTAVIWMAASGLLGGIVSVASITAYWVILAISGQQGLSLVALAQLLTSASSEGLFGGIGGVLVAATVSALGSGVLVAPAGLLLLSAVLLVSARLLGGSGSFEHQTYLLATFAAPSYVMVRALWLIPYVGWIVGVSVGIYQLILAKRAMQVTHDFTGPRAASSLLIPGLVTGFVLVCVVVSIASWWYFDLVPF